MRLYSLLANIKGEKAVILNNMPNLVGMSFTHRLRCEEEGLGGRRMSRSIDPVHNAGHLFYVMTASRIQDLWDKSGRSRQSLGERGCDGGLRQVDRARAEGNWLRAGKGRMIRNTLLRNVKKIRKNKTNLITYRFESSASENPAVNDMAAVPTRCPTSSHQTSTQPPPGALPRCHPAGISTILQLILGS